MNRFQAIVHALRSILFSPDYEKIKREIGEGRFRYRVVRAPEGYEAQMLYPSGITSQALWYPLNRQGYWAEPEASAFGPTRRSFLPTRREAEEAIQRARTINNNQPIVAAVPADNQIDYAEED